MKNKPDTSTETPWALFGSSELPWSVKKISGILYLKKKCSRSKQGFFRISKHSSHGFQKEWKKLLPVEYSP